MNQNSGWNKLLSARKFELPKSGELAGLVSGHDLNIALSNFLLAEETMQRQKEGSLQCKVK